MKTAAGNAGGAMTGFMGMNMAGMTGGFNAQNLYAMGQQQAAQAQQMAQPQPNPAVSQAQAGGSAPAADQWKCSCGALVSGNFCPECGAKKPQTPAANASWTCSCGAVNTGKFCTNCGSPKPAMKLGTAVTSAAGNRKIQPIRRNSVRTVAIHLMKTIPSKKAA